MRFVDVKLKCGWPDCEVVAPEGEDLVITRTIMLDGRKAREIDLCKEHSDNLDELLGPLIDDGRTVGTSVTKKTRKFSAATATEPMVTDVYADPDLICKVPDCDRHGRPAKSKTGMAQHVIRGHGYTSLAAYYEEFPPSTG